MAASPIGAVTVEQLLRNQPFIQGVYSRIGATGNVGQSFLGLGLETQSQQPVQPGTDVAAWDYFDNTRLLAEVRPNLSGPARPIAKPVGTAFGVLIRFYEALLFEDNRIAGFRPPGKPIGTLNKAGEDYVARQLKIMLQRQQNAREFMVWRMLRNGFDIKHLGADRQTLTEVGSGQIQVRYQIPSNHTAQVALDTASANVFDVTWATASADVIKHWHTLRQISERESGMPIKHGWLTSKPYINLINNDKLRAAGGSAFRVWEQMQTQKMQTLAGFRERGDDIEFRALPQAKFHVYDGVANVDQDRDSSVLADTSLFIPNDTCIITPEPSSEWVGQAVGQEIFTENYGQQPKTVTGSHNFVRREIAPTSSTDLHVWSKSLSLLTVPKAIYYPQVVF